MQLNQDGLRNLARKVYGLPPDKPNKKRKQNSDPLEYMLKFVDWPSEVKNLALKKSDFEPKRKVRRGLGHNSGDFQSTKNSKPVEYESGNEKRFYRLLERSSLVRWYVEQPIRIPHSEKSLRTTYTPDALVYLVDGRLIFVEIGDIYARR